MKKLDKKQLRTLAYVGIIGVLGIASITLFTVSKFEKAKYSEDIVLNKEGYISRINAELIGKLSVTLGAGRIKKEDNIDMTAGLVLNKKVGDYINKEEKIVTLYSNDKNKIEMAKNIIKDAIEISNNKSEKIPMILDVI